jgi:hypothetical protein
MVRDANGQILVHIFARSSESKATRDIAGSASYFPASRRNLNGHSN